MTRVEDEYPYDRNERATVQRIGVVSAVAVDGSTVDVDVPGGTLAAVPIAESITAPLGKRVLVLLDRDAAVVVCAVR
jgi:hypothetical protein